MEIFSPSDIEKTSYQKTFLFNSHFPFEYVFNQFLHEWFCSLHGFQFVQGLWFYLITVLDITVIPVRIHLQRTDCRADMFANVPENADSAVIQISGVVKFCIRND